MQKIPNHFSWYDRPVWHWPGDDAKLLAAAGTVHDIDVIMRYVPESRRRICIQAGGACGIWPARFAQFFSAVITFEPNEHNMACLVRNVPDNVITHQACLGAAPGYADLKLDDSEQGNAGAWYSVMGSSIEITTIDAFDLNNVDLIQLDIEGAEYDALMGAENTITQHWPVIVIEEKELPHMTERKTRARELLQDIGYKEVIKLHRDVVFVCG